MCDLIRVENWVWGQRASLHGAFPSSLTVIMALNSALSLQLLAVFCSGLFSLRMWNVSNIFCLRWPLAWVSAWILLVGAYEEARRCIWRKLLPSVHTTFWFCIFIPHLSGNSQGKGAKENPLMMDGYLKAIKFLFVSSETSVVFWVFLRTLRGKKSPEPIWEI